MKYGITIFMSQLVNTSRDTMIIEQICLIFLVMTAAGTANARRRLML